MRVAVVGTGNVGSALLYFLAASSHVNEVFVMSRSEAKSRAAVMDVASACPSGAQKLVPAPYARMAESDVVVLTAGATPDAFPDPKQLHAANLAIVEYVLGRCPWSSSTILILLGTPVDDITVFAQKRTGLPTSQVLGFGGDVDRNRLASVLLRRGKPANDINLVGEHGKRAIPVYPGEEDYAEIASQVRSYLATIIRLAGPPKNLATAVLLGQLVDSVATDTQRVHNVCGYHPELGLYLTWPFVIGREGVVRPEVVHLGAKAQADLEQLVTERRARAQAAGAI